LSYRLFSSGDYSFVKFSTEHAFDFIKGMQHLLALLLQPHTPAPLQQLLLKAKALIEKPAFAEIGQHAKSKELPIGNQLKLAHFLRYRFKQQMQDLLAIYYQLDAWYSMAKAAVHFQLQYPQFVDAERPLLKTEGLYHLLLQQPVAYPIGLSEGKNFLFLTGANMAGKSTFIKAVGAAVFLAHLGMGVPAAAMTLTVFDGLLSNINVADNIVKGESYFFNEVQRIKATVQKISDGKKWLILIDELFKGTNVLDAMKCSTAVIEGLLHTTSSIFILSTHLYEIGEPLRRYGNVLFQFFETRVVNGQLVFSYQLQDGISNDRLGYVILQREGVVDLLQQLKQ
jgi:DNA mismatch repair protein MutS